MVPKSKMDRNRSRSRDPYDPPGNGLPVDSGGGPTIDPTANVIALSAASNIRQDDLREANNDLIRANINDIQNQIEGLKELQKLRSEHTQEVALLRENHTKEMRINEAQRLDSIRQVDVTAVRTEATRALEAIQTLAATSARDAETLRTALVNTATTIASQTSETVKQITERIAALEKSSYEGVGKQRLADPMQAELLAEVKSLRDSRASVTGKSEGINATWAVIAAVVGLVFAGLGYVVARPSATVAPVAPQVIYVPAPAAGASFPTIPAPTAGQTAQ